MGEGSLLSDSVFPAIAVQAASSPRQKILVLLLNRPTHVGEATPAHRGRWRRVVADCGVLSTVRWPRRCEAQEHRTDSR